MNQEASCKFKAPVLPDLLLQIFHMAESPNDRADPMHALETLAKELNLQVKHVCKRYEESIAGLASKAKIDTYLHVFAMRDLVDKLSKHRQQS